MNQEDYSCIYGFLPFAHSQRSPIRADSHIDQLVSLVQLTTLQVLKHWLTHRLVLLRFHLDLRPYESPFQVVRL